MKHLLTIFAVIIFTLSLFAQTATAPSGSGTANDPYLIASLDNLYWISQNDSSWSSYFKQTADIDASSTENWFGGEGWLPISNNQSGPWFQGVYDGQGYVIDKLYINRSGTWVGLFGYVSSDISFTPSYSPDVILKNIHLTNVNISGGYAGALVGYFNPPYSQNSTIENCISSGNVYGTYYAGGLIGQLSGLSSIVLINSCGSTADVSGPTNIGGFVGEVESADFSQCFSSGKIICSGNFYGGFAGYVDQSATFQDCYCTGDITNGTVSAGGFAGYSVSYADYKNCYRTGGIIPLNSIATQGIPGFASSGNNSNCFWDSTMSQPDSIYAGIGTSKSATDLNKENTYSGWDFTNVWKIDSTVNDGYPYLRWQDSVTIPVSVDGISTSPTINNFFNIGFTAQDSSVSLSYTSIDSTPPSLPNNARTIGKYWVVSDITGGSVKLRLYYSASQKSSFTGTPTIYHYNGSEWVALLTDAEVTDGSKYYVETTDYYSSFSPVTVADNQTPLPVELTTFTANNLGNKIDLQWNTATEVNNYGFEVQRACPDLSGPEVSGQQASSSTTPRQDWGKIGFVKGSGNSNSPKNYSFIDDNPPSGTVEYRLKQIDNNGNFKYSQIVTVTSLPTKFELWQNYPNPFNPTTTIQYAIPKAEHVTLKVYDELGKEVSTLVDENKEAGQYRVNFNGSSLASGIYYYRISAGPFNEVKKLMLLK